MKILAIIQGRVGVVLVVIGENKLSRPSLNTILINRFDSLPLLVRVDSGVIATK